MVFNRKNNPFILVAGAVFILLKISYKYVSTQDLLFLLKPVDKIVGSLLNSHAQYIPDVGFYHERWNITIDKSCSGFNFMLLTFVLFVFLLVPYFERAIYKTTALIWAFFGAYLVTIFTNSCRIYVSIIVQNQTSSIFPSQQHIIHEVIGIATNLCFLILTFFALHHFLHKTKNNETLA